MTNEWSEINKEFQQAINKKATYQTGIQILLELRNTLFNSLLDLISKLTKEEFYQIPYINAKGYHNKSIAYSIWHIFRIEDIVLNSLIKKETEVLFTKDYLIKINSSIITTGNELQKEVIKDFSQRLVIDELINYITDVKNITDQYLKTLTYQELQRKFDINDQTRLIELKVVSPDPLANWLIPYWCSKNIKGLLQMPFSRHWIMHIEAIKRIIDKLNQ